MLLRVGSLLVILCIATAAMAAEGPLPATSPPAMSVQDPMVAPRVAAMVAPMAPAMGPVAMVLPMGMVPVMAPVAPVSAPPMSIVAADFSMRVPVTDTVSEDDQDAEDDPPSAPISQPSVKPAIDSGVAPTAVATKMAPGGGAAAAPAAGGSLWKSLFSGLLHILLLFLTAIALGLGSLLSQWVVRKVKVSDVELQTALEGLYNTAIEMGVNFAEQQAKKLAANPDAKGKRIEWAVEKVQEMIKDLGLAEKAADWIRTRIEAKLGEQNRSKSAGSPT